MININCYKCVRGCTVKSALLDIVLINYTTIITYILCDYNRRVIIILDIYMIFFENNGKIFLLWIIE